MELASQLKHSNLPLLLINQELFGMRTYSVQPKELLNDIRNYKTTFDLAKQMYMTTFAPADPGDNWDDWWANDVYGWGNNDAPTQNGYMEKMYALWEVFVPLWCDNMRAPEYFRFVQVPLGRRPINYYKIDSFLSSYLDKKTSKQQLRCFWGAMKPGDRIQFLESRMVNPID